MIDDLLNGLSRTFSFPRLEALVQRVTIGGMLHGFRAVGLMRPVPVTPESHVHQRTKVVAEEAQKRGWKVEMLSFLGHTSNIFLLTENGREHVFEGLPGMDPAKVMTKVDDKEWTKYMLGKLGVPTPQGECFSRLAPALAYGKTIGYPLVVKPRTGSLSAHTTVNIQNDTELERAILCSQHVSPSFIVERYIPGSLYRATTVGPNVAAIGRRDPPTIVGDGKKTVAELIVECEAAQRDLLIALGYKPEEVPSLPKNHMKRNPEDILAPGESLAVTWKINLSYGASVTDVTAEAHPDNVELFERVAKEVKLPSIGIDFLAPDITVSWKDQPCGIIELNSLPSIDLHHQPIVKGTFRNVASALLDFVYGSTLKKSDS